MRSETTAGGPIDVLAMDGTMLLRERQSSREKNPLSAKKER